jgi:hypothetical protein
MALKLHVHRQGGPTCADGRRWYTNGPLARHILRDINRLARGAHSLSWALVEDRANAKARSGAARVSWLPSLQGSEFRSRRPLPYWHGRTWQTGSAAQGLPWLLCA